MSSTSETRRPAGRLNRLLLPVSAAILIVVCFGPSFSSGTLISHDDSVLRLSTLAHVKHVPQLFSQFFMAFTDGEYRPLAYAMLATMRTWFSPESTVFWRLWLLGFHVVNSLLVYAIAGRFARKTLSAVVAGAAFLLHPAAFLFTIGVDLFYQPFAVTLYLGSLLCYLGALQKGCAGLYAGALALFVAGLFTSNVLLTLPVLLLMVEALHARSRIVPTFARLVPFAAAAVLMLWLTLPLHPHPMHYKYRARLPSTLSWHSAHSLIGRGVEGTVHMAAGRRFPQRMGILVGSFDEPWNVRIVFWGVVLGIALTASFITMRRPFGEAGRRKYVPEGSWIGVGVLLMVLGVAPTFVSSYAMTDDYRSWSVAYLPLVGFTLTFAAVFDSVHSRMKSVAGQWISVAVAIVPIATWAAMLFTANMRAGDALSLWKYALDENPSWEHASVQLGKTYLALDRKDEALQHLFNPRLGSLREGCIAMTHYYASKGKRIEATVHLLIGAGEEAPGLQFQDDMMALYHVMFRFNAPDHAENALGKLLMANPTSVRGLSCLAKVLNEKGYVRGARRCLRGALDIDPGDHEARDLLDEVNRRLTDPARLDLQREISAPDPTWLRYVLGQGISTELEEEVVALADVHPEDPVMQLGAAICLMGNARGDRPIVRLDKARARLGGIAHVNALKIRVAAFEQMPQLAEEVIADPGRILPRDHITWHRLGDILVGYRQYRLALEAYRVALRAKPDSAETHNNLGVILLKLEDFPGAIEHLTRALSLPPDKISSVHNDLGFALAENGRYEEAMERFHLAIETDPSQPHPWRHMARVVQRMGDHRKAVEIVEEAIRLFPNDEKLKMRLAWVLSTSTDPKVRDGKRAVTMMEKLVDQTTDELPRMLDVLAAAYAEDGRFKEAEDTQRRAIEAAVRTGQMLLASDFAGRLAHYEQRTPFRETFRPR